MSGSEWKLYVEGKDDKNVSLISSCDTNSPRSPSILSSPEARTRCCKRSVSLCLLGLGSRWGSFSMRMVIPAVLGNLPCHGLTVSALKSPRAIPADGFVGKSEEFGARVGVWIMPDNRRSGAIEDFLKDLIRQFRMPRIRPGRPGSLEQNMATATPGKPCSMPGWLGRGRPGFPTDRRSVHTIFKPTAKSRGGSLRGLVDYSVWRRMGLRLRAVSAARRTRLVVRWRCTHDPPVQSRHRAFPLPG